jgi:hypothetical protein
MTVDKITDRRLSCFTVSNQPLALRHELSGVTDSFFRAILPQGHILPVADISPQNGQKVILTLVFCASLPK